jgi:regulatory protein
VSEAGGWSLEPEARLNAYSAALELLSRRELSAAQLRDRLTRRGFAAADIDSAIDRLTRDHTVDDRRVALASARKEATVKARGRRRIVQAIQRLGVSAEVARTAVDDLFGEVDESAILDRALDKRLRGASAGDLDVKARARLVRQLIAQGFEPAQVLARLRRRGVEVDE